MIKYLGSKRRLLPHIAAIVERHGGRKSVLDLFSGTSRVGHHLKRLGHFVQANDHNRYAWVLGRCYVQADARRVRDEASRLIGELDALPGRRGYFTETFCEQSRFFQPANGMRVDAIRERLATLSLDPDVEAVALTALMEAADRVDSTTGVQMAYLKEWAPRSYNRLRLRVPEVLPGDGRASCLEAGEAVEASPEFGLTYCDPPYNQHSYLGNYHVWETLVRWDRPEAYGVARKRSDCRERRSEFNSKRKAQPALFGLLRKVASPHLLVSFSNEGFVSRQEFEGLLREIGHLSVLEVGLERYVGAKIGIYNPAGEKVGRVGHTRNVEYLYFVSQSRRAAAAVAELAARAGSTARAG